MLGDKKQKDTQKEEEQKESYRNTEVPKPKDTKRAKDQESKKELLRMKLDENKDFYDFKYIKRELNKPEQDKIYLS